MLGTALIFTGGFEAGRELVSTAADLAQSHPDLSGELRAYLGRSLRLAGYHDRALAVLEELVATARARVRWDSSPMHSPASEISSSSAGVGRRLPASSTRRSDWLARRVKAQTKVSRSAPSDGWRQPRAEMTTAASTVLQRLI